jgi:hypothetical protein
VFVCLAHQGFKKKYQALARHRTSEEKGRWEEGSGPEDGVGSSYSWSGDQLGEGVLEITSSEMGRGIVYLLHFEGAPTADGVVQITPMKGGCEVLWKMSGDTSRPLGPYLVPWMDSFIGSDFEEGLKGLQEKCS